MDNYDIFSDIFRLLNTQTQTAFVLTCNILKQNFTITNFSDRLGERRINHRASYSYSDKPVLANKIFENLKSLSVHYFSYYYSNIKLPFLKNLKNIKFGEVAQKSLVELDPIELEIGYIVREKIWNEFCPTKISHMKNLKILHLPERCDITNDEIADLKLERLYMPNNYKIHDLNFMKTLKTLDASDSNNGLMQAGIVKLNLVEFNMSDNSKIIDVAFMSNLKKLIASGRSGITETGLLGLKLIELDVSNNKNIQNVTHLTTLKVLHINGVSAVDQSGIANLDLVELHANGNKSIVNVAHMRNLKILGAGHVCGIDQYGIENLDLRILYAHNNAKITSVTHMRNLEYLDASGDCGIGPTGIAGLNQTKIAKNCNEKLLS